jgi:DNA gyrase subunit B
VIYDARTITVLSGLEAIRRRPAMYVGSTSNEGVQHLLDEVVQNAVDEALAGACDRILVTRYADGSLAVEDNGRGIPVDDHPDLGRPACEIVLTHVHAGGKFGGGGYGVAGGLHGVGLACVNALSESLELDVWRDAQHYQQRFARGNPTQDLRHLGAGEQASGTRIHFKPDDEIFNGAMISLPVLTRRLQEQAFLHPGLTVEIVDEQSDFAATYAYDTGIVGFVEHLNQGRNALHPTLHFMGERQGVTVDVAIQWTNGYSEDISSYVNSIRTPKGGAHLDGLKAALTQVINRYAKDQRLLNEDTTEEIAGYDVREGMTTVLSLRMANPEFEGQTKTTLTSLEVEPIVEGFISEALSAFLNAQPGVAATIVGKALEASRARAAARRASERARYQLADAGIDKEVYLAQFGIRSKNWHESAIWLTHKELLTAHADLTRVSTDAKVLDVCCGSGVVGASFKDRVGSVVGLDLTPEMIAMAETRLDKVYRGDVYDMPFEDNSFDMVVNREVLHLLPRPEQPVSEMFRVLRPGGQLVVGQLLPYGAIDAPWFFRVVKKKQPLFFNNFTAERFRALLEGCGFEVVEEKEVLQWEDIDLWIETHETPNLMRHEIRELYYNAPADVREVHPFEVHPNGSIRDCWRWVVFSAIKPGGET